MQHSAIAHVCGCCPYARVCVCGGVYKFLVVWSRCVFGNFSLFAARSTRCCRVAFIIFVVETLHSPLGKDT